MLAATIALTPPASADSAADAYAAELSRIGITISPDSLAGNVAQVETNCHALRSGKATTFQVAEVMSELMSDNATKRQVWGVVAAGVKSYCPDQIGTVYEDTARAHLQLP